MKIAEKHIASFAKVWGTFVASVAMGVLIFSILIVGTGEMLDIFVSGWWGDSYQNVKTDIMLVPAWIWIVLVFYIAANGTLGNAGDVFGKFRKASQLDVWAGLCGTVYAVLLAGGASYLGRNADFDPAAGSALSMAGPIAVFGCTWPRLCIALSARTPRLSTPSVEAG